MKEGNITMAINDYEAILQASCRLQMVCDLIGSGAAYADDAVKVILGLDRAKQKPDKSLTAPARVVDRKEATPAPEPAKEPEEPVLLAVDPDEPLPDPEPDENSLQKYPAKRGAKADLDVPKMATLRRAGWTYEKIAMEMRCSQQTVINRLAADGYDKDGNKHD